MASEGFQQIALREFQRMKRLADQAISQIEPEAFFSAPGPGDNSLAVIVKHMAGNLRSRWRDFLTADGEKPDRNRDEEFVIRPEDSREALLARWEDGWQILFDALRPLAADDLHRTVTIRGEPLTALQAIIRQLSHYSYHVGQIVYLGKHHAGPQWESLSIPLGQSSQFNQSPTRYLDSR